MLRKLAIAASVLILTSVQQAPARSLAAIDAAVEGFIVPGYDTLQRRTAALRDTMASLCSVPSTSAADGARRAFGETVDSWSRIEIVRFGPITEMNRLERFLFWPDRKGIGLRQVQAAIASEDEKAADPAQLAGKSVAMQGLGALEFVLFGSGSDTLSTSEGAYRCRYGLAIAGNLAVIADSVASAWRIPGGFAAHWASPGEDNSLHRTEQEALSELLKVFVDGLEIVRDVRLQGFLGPDAAEDRPKEAIYWRSAHTSRSLAGNLAGMKALFDASHIGEDFPADARWIAQSIDFEFGNAVNAATAAEGPIADVLADPARRGKLAYLAIVTSSLSELFATRLADQFGLKAGFSSLDGD